MAMPKLLWVINPNAGRGEIAAKAAECIGIFEKAGYTVSVHITEKAQDATDYIRAHAAEYDRIVCAGGDGTLNEAVTGLMAGKKRPPLGYIPAGTTNDFAASLNIPKNPLEAAHCAVGDVMRALDIGRFNNRYFNYIAAFGLFTEVSYATPQQSKNIFGRAAYIMEGIKSLGNVKTHHVTVQSEQVTGDGDYIYGMVTNSLSVGGFKTLSPDGVLLDDGLYEVLLVYPPENPMELQELVGDLLTNNQQSERFLYFRTSHVRFLSEQEVPWTLDGEFGGAQTDVTIENNKQAITFVTGQA